MDKETLQAIVNTLSCLDLTDKEKTAIIAQWIIKEFDQSEAVELLTDLDKTIASISPTLENKVTLGNIIDLYRESSIWGDNKSYRGFVGTLVEEYSILVKSKREMINNPAYDEVAASKEFLETVANNKLVQAVIEQKFKEALTLIGLRSKEDAVTIANEWFTQVTAHNTGESERKICEKLRESIASISTKNTYSGTYNIEKVKNIYRKDDSKFSCISVLTFIDVAQKVLTTFNGTRESLLALLDYKGVEMSIEEIDALIPKTTRSTYPEDIYERVYKSLELFF